MHQPFSQQSFAEQFDVLYSILKSYFCFHEFPLAQLVNILNKKEIKMKRMQNKCGQIFSSKHRVSTFLKSKGKNWQKKNKREIFSLNIYFAFTLTQMPILILFSFLFHAVYAYTNLFSHFTA